MIQAFCEGLETAGHEYGVYEVCKMNIHGCLACEYCHTKGNGQCVQKDDMQFVYHELQEAEMLVIASPIYYHGLSGQLKCTIDRFYAAAYPNKPEKLKKVAMFLSSGDPDMYDGALFSRTCMTGRCSHIREIFWIICSWKIWEFSQLMDMISVYRRKSWRNFAGLGRV